MIAPPHGTEKVGKLYRERGVWHIRLRVNGRYTVRSTGERSKTRATRIWEYWQFMVFEERPVIRPGKLGKVFNEWLAMKAQENRPSTMKVLESQVDIWLRSFDADMEPSRIKVEHIDGHIRNRFEQCSKPTLLKDLGRLSSFFDWAKKKKYCQSNPVSESDVPLANRIPRKAHRYTEQELDDIERILGGMDKLWVFYAFKFLRWSGFRPGMIERLRWGHVNRRAERIQVPAEQMKNGTYFEAPMLPQLRAVVGELARFTAKKKGIGYLSGPDNLIFPGVSYAKIYSYFKKAAILAGLPGFEPRDLRRFLHNWLRKHGFTLEENCAMLGHNSKEIALKHYSNVSIEEIERRINTLPSPPNAFQRSSRP